MTHLCVGVGVMATYRCYKHASNLVVQRIFKVQQSSAETSHISVLTNFEQF